MRLKKHILTIITAAGLGLVFGWGFGGHEAKAQDAKKTKEMKSKEEYDLYDAYNKAAAKDKPAALDKWKQAFPQSDFAEDREYMYLQAYESLKDIRKIFDKAVEMLKTRPNFYYALQDIIGYAPQLNPLQPADLDNTERIMKHVLDDSNTVFSAANKPDGVTDAQWAGVKPQIVTLSQRTYAWVFIQRKDYPKAEVEITKYLQMDPTQAQFTYFLAQALLAQNKTNPEKAAPTLFHFARAAAYDGQNSFPEAQRKTVNDYVTKAYKDYHCSDEGLPQLLTTAKANVFPPAGFNIKSCSVIAQEKADEEARIAAADPVGTFWRNTIKKPLLEDPMFWSGSLEGALIPGEAGKPTHVDKFKAKLISQAPATKPKTLVLGLEKADVPDITLVFDEALPGNMEPGSALEFEGVAKAFTKEPFMLTLEVTKDQLVGWTGTNPKAPPKGKGPAKGTGKGPAKAAK